MEQILTHRVEHTSVRGMFGFAAFFTPGKPSFILCDIAKGEFATHPTKYPVVNVELLSKHLYVFFEKSHHKYSVPRMALEEDVLFADVVFKLPMAHESILYVRETEFVIEKRGNITERHPVTVSGFASEKCIFGLYDGYLEVYNQRARVYKREVEPSARMWASVRNNKVYLLGNNRITGHDLNLYLDDVKDFTADRFVNIENEVVLYDGTKRELRIYMKNMNVLVFSCAADDFVYIEGKNLLYVLRGGEFVLYKRVNPYTASFKHIPESVTYVEQEDEFDESDSEYADFE